MLETGAFLQVADGELDCRVIAVELVDFDGGQFDVGDERVVAPVGPQSSLGDFGEASAAHDQAQLASVPALGGHVRALGDLGLAAVGIGDGGPRRLCDRVDRLAMLGLMRTVTDHRTPRRDSVSMSA